MKGLRYIGEKPNSGSVNRARDDEGTRGPWPPLFKVQNILMKLTNIFIR